MKCERIGEACPANANASLCTSQCPFMLRLWFDIYPDDRPVSQVTAIQNTRCCERYDEPHPSAFWTIDRSPVSLERTQQEEATQSRADTQSLLSSTFRPRSCTDAALRNARDFFARATLSQTSREGEKLVGGRLGRKLTES